MSCRLPWLPSPSHQPDAITIDLCRRVVREFHLVPEEEIGLAMRLLFDAERDTIVTLRDRGEINSDVMRRVERDIDLEELRESG